MMPISILVAISESGLIAEKRGVPWEIIENPRRYHKITNENPVIIDYKTYKALGNPLPNKINLVLKRSVQRYPKSTIMCNSLRTAIKKANEKATKESKEIMVIGGKRIYKKFLPKADFLYITTIHGLFGGNEYFPIKKIRKSKKWKKMIELNKRDYSFELFKRMKKPS